MIHGDMIVILTSLKQRSCVLNFELVSEPSDDGSKHHCITVSPCVQLMTLTMQMWMRSASLLAMQPLISHRFAWLISVF